jgi:tetratricopeptide (TPR) repeat protein
VAAAVGQRLAAGDQVMPAAGSRAILITRAGANQVVTAATTVSAPATGGNPDIFDRAMKTLAQAASADARTAGGRQGMIRPIPGEPTLVAPRNGLTVVTTRPTFTWRAADNAKTEQYTIQIRPKVRPADGSRPMRFQVTGTSFTYPDDTPALVPGETYLWTVAPKGSRAAREESVRVIDTAEREQLTATLSRITDLGLDPAGDGAFLAAVVYRDMDLMYDAAQALDAVESAGSMAADAYLLKGEILNRLGRSDEARRAFDKADEMMR